MVEKRQNNSGSQSQLQTQSALQSGQTVTQSLASQTGSQSLTAAPMPTIPSNAPPGLISVTQPSQQSTPFYKIAPSEPITFAWELSNIIVTPTHLTVSAACEHGNTYPVGPTDGIIPGTATSVVWDTYAYQTSHPQLPLAQAEYTLEIWGDQGPDAQSEPGFLTPNSAVHFSLYTP
ncbi:hypothetical protein JVT61DRAFT_10130 [Boletus reticuloceps]|uniref:DUF7137 domain-containing protein n=1 Tax=Boletus reticuloceps TaxID=495285 RepID=A0A8I2YXM7_9AGAM|nr:hypothetical protein JVT61DRAFT_10130 [Boletus reticuloceps]